MRQMRAADDPVSLDELRDDVIRVRILPPNGRQRDNPLLSPRRKTWQENWGPVSRLFRQEILDDPILKVQSL
jgi:hypothetical protein